MAHNITKNKQGEYEIFFAGEVPWHGLGTQVSSVVTAEEAIKLAHLDWEVGVFPVSVNSDNGVFEINDSKAIARLDSSTKQIETVFGVVGNYYTPIQNHEAFDFFDSVVGEGKARYEVAGSLGKGETIWILARILDGDIRIEGTDDISRKYLLLSNSHNGKRSLKLFFTPVRVVCQNTLNFAFGNRQDVSEGVNIRHFPNIQNKVIEAKKILGFAVSGFELAEQAFNALNKYQFNTEKVKEYVNKVFETDQRLKKDGTLSVRLKNQLDVVTTLFDAPENNLPGISGSAWSAYNAVTMFADHIKPVSGVKDDPSRKLSSVWLGGSAQLKQKALNDALELCNLPTIPELATL